MGGHYRLEMVCVGAVVAAIQAAIFYVWAITTSNPDPKN